MLRALSRTAVVAAATFALAACSASTGAQTDGAGADTSGDALAAVDAADLVPAEIVARGPYDETSATLADLELSEEQKAEIRSAEIEVGIVMQTMDIEWSTEQVRGITDGLAELGGSVVGTCNGAWAVDKQTACIDDMISKQPDAIISIPVDDVGMAPAYARVADAGIKLVFIDNIGQGLDFPSQYQGLVTADNRGNGQAAAQALAEYLPDGATAGVLDYGVDFETTKQRTLGFTEWMSANRPDVTVKVTEFQDAAKAGDVAANFLTANPDVAGMFTVWEVPAMGIVTALRGQGKSLPITVVNMGSDIALDVASGGMIKMVGAQLPYDEGVAEATMAARAVVGIENPPFLAVPATPVIQSNLLTAWQEVYKTDAPQEIQDACAGACG